MSVMIGAGGRVLLGAGGMVAIDPACCCGGCTACGDRITATFSGVSGAYCLNDFEWPMGYNGTDVGVGVYGWSSFVDGGSGALSCVDSGSIQIAAGCSGIFGWFIDIYLDGSISPYAGASGLGGFPLGVPTVLSLFGGGTDGFVTITCGGSWGSCCNFFGACYGCVDLSTGEPGGLGPDQCTVMIAGLSGPGTPATYNGDHSTCNPTPCDPGTDC